MAYLKFIARLLWLVYVFCATMQCAWAESFNCSSIPLWVTKTEQGQQYGFYATAEQMLKTEQWSPALGAPPLAMDKIVAVLEKWSSSKYPEYDRVVVDGISLRNYHCPDVSARWYYIVDYIPVIDGGKKMGKYSSAVILMDGSVLSAVPKK